MEETLRIPRFLTIVAASVVLVALLVAGWLLSRPRGRVLREATLSPSEISPNADGERDVTRIDYRLARPATVAIYFEAEDGRRYDFRENSVRGRGEYSVLFGGIVDGFVLDGETIKGDVEARLLPDGEYTWVIEAQESGRPMERLSGPFTVRDGDPVLPDMQEFSVSPPVFTPNQDGFDDRVSINIYLPKPADLQVYLVDAEGVRFFIPESQEGRRPGEEGMHTFDYEGGVDQGVLPPPDGAYEVIAIAEDDEGQRAVRRSELSIRNGGVPLAEIVAQPVGDTVEFSSEAVMAGETLYFTLTVENYSDTPLRTTGPFSGETYQQDERASTLGYFEESGAWRVGLDCDTCLSDYPWRWALGTSEELTAVEVDGTTQYYLMPGQRVVVTGGVTLSDIEEARNPQYFWAGLIHEDVGITPFNNRVDAHLIEIVEP
jgi:hypothetical protein